MDILTLVSLISGVLGIIGAIIQFLVDKDKIVGLSKNPDTQKIIKFLVLACFTLALYGYFIYPAVKVYSWNHITSVSDANNAVKNDYVRLQQQSKSSSFRTTVYEEKTLFLDDVFPTAFAVLEENNKKIYLAGTYGAGIFTSTQPPYWEFLGLRDLVITEIVTASNAPSLIWAATNLGVAFSNDYGKTWNMTGPINDLVTVLTVDSKNPMMLFAGTLNGLYVSSDGGMTWLGPSLEGDVITSIEIAQSNSNRIYVSCLHSKVYRSDNSGNSWTTIREPDEFGSTPLELDPNNPDIVYIGPSDFGLFRSKDAGVSWEYLGLKGTSISSIMIMNTTQQTIYVGTDENRGLYVSKNNGATWQNYGLLEDSIVAIHRDTDIPNHILILTKRSGVLSTQDFGNSWTAMGLASFSIVTDFSPSSLVLQKGNPDKLIASSLYAKGLFKSDNSGFSWSPLSGNSELLNYSLQSTLVNPYNINHLIVSTYGGNVLESRDSGNTWNNITANLPLGGYASLAISEQGDLFAGANDQGVWKKAANELLWTPTGLMGYSIESVYIGLNNLNVYAFDNGGVLHVSYDGGTSWTEPSYIFRALSMRASDETLIGISQQYDILMSTDNAHTWSKVQEITPSARSLVPSIVIDNEAGCFYISYDKVLLKSEDTGRTWQELELPEYGDLQVASGSEIYFLGNQALHISNNYGETFKPVKYKSLVASSTHQIRLDTGVFLLGASDNGVFASFDNLQTWTQTSIGVGENVLALGKVETPEQRVIALIANLDGVKIASSTDGKVWSVIPTECQSFAFTHNIYGHSSNYFEEITDGTETIWQLECSEPKGMLIIKPNHYDNYQFFNLEELNLDISDALIMPDNSLYILTIKQNAAEVYIISDSGKKSQLIGQFNRYYTWGLTNDSRSEGILIVKEDGMFAGSFSPQQTAPILVYLALFFTISLCFIVVFLPKQFANIIQNIKWLFSWFVRNPIFPGKKISPYFIAIVSPNIILLSILVFQISPQLNAVSNVLSHQSFDEVAYYFAKAFLRSESSLFTGDGAVFVGILITYILTILFTSLMLTLSVASGGLQKTIFTWLDGFGNGLALFTIAIPEIYILTTIANQFQSAFNQTLFGLSMTKIINLWFVFLWFRVLAIVLYRISYNYKRPIKKMASSLILGIIIGFITAPVLLSSLGSSLSVEAQSVIKAIPFLPIGFLTGFLVLVQTFLYPTVVLKRKPTSLPHQQNKRNQS